MLENQGILPKGDYWHFWATPSLVGMVLWGVRVCLGTITTLPEQKARLLLKQPDQCIIVIGASTSSWRGARFQRLSLSVARLRGPAASFLLAGLSPALQRGFCGYCLKFRSALQWSL